MPFNPVGPISGVVSGVARPEIIIYIFIIAISADYKPFLRFVIIILKKDLWMPFNPVGPISRVVSGVARPEIIKYIFIIAISAD